MKEDLTKIYRCHQTILQLRFVCDKLATLKSTDVNQFRAMCTQLREIFIDEKGKIELSWTHTPSKLANMLHQDPNFETSFSAFLNTQPNGILHQSLFALLSTGCTIPTGEQRPEGPQPSMQLLLGLLLVLYLDLGEKRAFSVLNGILPSVTEGDRLKSLEGYNWELLLQTLNKRDALTRRIGNTFTKLSTCATDELLPLLRGNFEEAKAPSSPPSAPLKPHHLASVSSPHQAPTPDHKHGRSHQITKSGQNSQRSADNQTSPPDLHRKPLSLLELASLFLNQPSAPPLPPTNSASRIPLIEFYDFHKQIKEALDEQHAPDHALMTVENANSFYNYLVTEERKLLHQSSFDLVGIFFYYIDHYEPDLNKTTFGPK